MEKAFVTDEAAFHGLPMFILDVQGHMHHDNPEALPHLNIVAAIKLPGGELVTNAHLEITLNPFNLAGMVANLIYCDENEEFRAEYEKYLAEMKIHARKDLN